MNKLNSYFLKIRTFLTILNFYKWLKLGQCKKPIMLELGSGPKRGVNGWKTIDVIGSDIDWDLRRGIFLPKGSVHKLYSSHLLEHLDYKNLIKFIRECHRSLIEGGEFLVCVPNARLYLEAYVNNVNFRENNTLWPTAVCNSNSFIDQVNYIAYMGGQHKIMFDECNLVSFLLDCGFSEAKLRVFDPLLDSRDRDFESIYIVARK